MIRWYERLSVRLAISAALVIVALAAMLAGCSTLPKGVTMSPEEAKACEENGCTVWTMDELKNLARQFYLKGVQAGKDAT